MVVLTRLGQSLVLLRCQQQRPLIQGSCARPHEALVHLLELDCQLKCMAFSTTSCATPGTRLMGVHLRGKELLPPMRLLPRPGQVVERWLGQSARTASASVATERPLRFKKRSNSSTSLPLYFWCWSDGLGLQQCRSGAV